MKTAAVVVAAGRGRRMQTEPQPTASGSMTPGLAADLRIPKQFLPLMGRPLITYALKTLNDCDCIGRVVLVVGSSEVETVQNSIVKRFQLRKVEAVVPGGEERQHSVWNGLATLLAKPGEAWEYVVVHDGVRPLVTAEMVRAVLEAARQVGAATVAVPARETIKFVDPEGMVVTTPDRRRLWAVQTPQAFRLDLLAEAHRRAAADGFLGPDDCSLVERLGQPVRVVMGSPANVKVTTPEDLIMVDALLARHVNNHFAGDLEASLWHERSGDRAGRDRF